MSESQIVQTKHDVNDGEFLSLPLMFSEWLFEQLSTRLLLEYSCVSWNRQEGVEDQLMVLAGDLWNYHLRLAR
ncbi:hypothetical protein [Leptolyngbya sp. FACHB-261]|uniref:hypothetical protein n=1 Tax=Leptolyngbya sp. FACHB-261 TaxID=2692806 RepID=UPI001687E82F|nr:hypothetical protein [Leptolyngbya sp. FACHB-261]